MSEEARLASLGARTGPYVWLEHARGATDLAAAFAAEGGAIVIRTAWGAPIPVAALVPLGPVALPLARAAAASFVELATATPPMRAAAMFEGCCDDDAIEAALQAALADRTGGAAPPGIARLESTLQLARSRAGEAPLIAHHVASDARFGHATRRDPRSGVVAIRIAWSSSPRALLEAPAAREPSTLETARAHTFVDEVASELELASGDAHRLGLLASGDTLRVLALGPERRTGALRCALAVERAERGVLERDAAIASLEPAEVRVVIEERLVHDEHAIVAVGIAAGVGVAEGLVRCSPGRALEHTGAGLPAILFVHDLDPDDAPALRASAGVVCVRGGITSEAAIMARALGRPCMASGAGLSLTREGVRVAHTGPAQGPLFTMLYEGDRVTLDAARGRLVRGSAARVPTPTTPAATTLLGWLRPALDRVLVDVVTPEHVATGAAYGSRAFSVCSIAELVHEAQRDGDSFDAALEARIAGLLRALPVDAEPLALLVPAPADPACCGIDGLPRRLVAAALTASSALDRRVEIVVPFGVPLGDPKQARWSHWTEVRSDDPVAPGLSRRLVRGSIADGGIERLTAESPASADGVVCHSLLVRAPADSIVAAAIAVARAVR
jgi:phosphohistidine swiveling domain-containing protein